MREPLALLDQGAEFDPYRFYRFRLWRRWAPGPLLLVIGLNPSTADETHDDPTVRRCLGYAHHWGFSGLALANIFAFRATDPRMLKVQREPVGFQNLEKIAGWAREIVADGGAVLAAWGAHGSFVVQGERIGQGDLVMEVLEAEGISAACLGLTELYQPRHPLYLPKNAVPRAYLGDGGRLVTEWGKVDAQ